MCRPVKFECGDFEKDKAKQNRAEDAEIFNKKSFKSCNERIHSLRAKQPLSLTTHQEHPRDDWRKK